MTYLMEHGFDHFLTVGTSVSFLPPFGLPFFGLPGCDGGGAMHKEIKDATVPSSKISTLADNLAMAVVQFNRAPGDPQLANSVTTLNAPCSIINVRVVGAWDNAHKTLAQISLVSNSVSTTHMGTT